MWERGSVIEKEGFMNYMSKGVYELKGENGLEKEI